MTEHAPHPKGIALLLALALPSSTMLATVNTMDSLAIFKMDIGFKLGITSWASLKPSYRAHALLGLPENWAVAHIIISTLDLLYAPPPKKDPATPLKDSL